MAQLPTDMSTNQKVIYNFFPEAGVLNRELCHD